MPVPNRSPASIPPRADGPERDTAEQAVELPDALQPYAPAEFPHKSTNHFVIKRALNLLRNADADFIEVLRGSALAFIVKILAAGLAFAMNVVISRQLGAQEAGLFFLGYTIVFVAATVSRLGLDFTFVRFIAGHQVTKEWGQIKKLYQIGIGWSIMASVGVAAIFWWLADYLAIEVFGKPAFADVIRIMAWTIPITALFTLQAKALQGIRHVAQSIILVSGISPLVILILALIISPNNAVTTGWMFTAASGCALLLGIYWWSRLPLNRTPSIDVDRKQILASCLPLLGVAVLNQTVTWSSQIMLGVWASSADIAVFNAAQRTAMLVSFALAAVNTIAAPKFAAMSRNQDHQALVRTATDATRLMAALALAPLALMLAFPHAILSTFGSEFTAGANTLRILAIGQIISVAAGPVGLLLSMSGHERLLRNNVFIAAIASLALGFALIPLYGLIGAAIASAGGIALQNLLCVWQVWRVHGFSAFGRRK